MTRATGMLLLCAAVVLAPSSCCLASEPTLARRGMVVAQDRRAAQIGLEALRDGGSAVDAVLATAFAMAVTHPAAGNIGGGGFAVVVAPDAEPSAYDFRETAPGGAHPTMWLVDGEYDPARHHDSHLAVGVPGTVAGLHLLWKDHGRLPWPRLVRPAIALAADGFEISFGLARSIEEALPRLECYPASMTQFTDGGVPLEPGDILRQPDLARTLRRIAEHGPSGFYEGPVAARIHEEMQSHGGILTAADLAGYEAVRRAPIRGTYRGRTILGMPPPSSGGVAVIEMLNILEGFDLAEAGFGSARNLHRYAEAARRAFADRARYLGDPEGNPEMPLDRLTSKDYADQLRGTIDPEHASRSQAETFSWRPESEQTTHISVLDADGIAVALTYTLEQPYGSGIVAPGTGFLLNNEMGDFNAAPGLTTETGLIGSEPNLAEPGRRMLSSMSPTIVLAPDGEVLLVTGSPGGRTIISTVMQTIVNVIDFDMNAQDAVDAGRVHHQWFPDVLFYERQRFSPDTLSILESMGHAVRPRARPGAAQVILWRSGKRLIEGGTDRRVPDGAAVGW